MNSAELPIGLQVPAENLPWENVRRIYRRVCLLRAIGRGEEAAAIENGEFANALIAARIGGEPGVDEAALLAEETERVSSASVLADVLAPLLAERLRGEIGSLAFRSPSPTVSAKPAVASDPPIPPSPPPPAAVPQIADMIDGMLAQQKPAPRARSR